MKIFNKLNAIFLLVLVSTSISIADDSFLLGIYYGNQYSEEINYLPHINSTEIKNNKILSDICFYIFEKKASKFKFSEAGHYLELSYKYNPVNPNVVNAIEELKLNPIDELYTLEYQLNHKFRILNEVNSI
ncbi:hypothetical protein [Cysteiniphilum sp. SYW-8]|uniref:hypothetical protein n=1 Tax=Cysteiniphilum sp. SYW-8 TaxID=2610890 RepID=UPI00123D076F|nr:hypothetical protein [Cysteiniphilum sp. SYW-8]